jgi:hypothetical protein
MESFTTLEGLKLPFISVAQLQEKVDDYFLDQDHGSEACLNHILKDFQDTLDKWIEDKTRYSNEYIRRYYGGNHYMKDEPAFDPERHFWYLRQWIEKALGSLGYQASIRKIEDGIEVKITWEV